MVIQTTCWDEKEEGVLIMETKDLLGFLETNLALGLRVSAKAKIDLTASCGIFWFGEY